MGRSLRFVSVLPWLVASACCTSGGHQAAAADAKPATPAATAPASSSGAVPPEVIAKLRADLAKQVGADVAESARVTAAESVMWPNGALGCPQPGRMYTQAIVPGYQVVFDAGGRTFAYHASQKGGFVLCKDPVLDQPPSSETVR
jgi:hypothetical protein